MEEKTLRVTAVIPAYNEAGRIGKTIAGLRGYVDEILVIDDGSRDETAQAAEAAGARVLRQEQNQGYIAAIKRGFQEAAGEIVVTFDADGEFPADILPQLVAPIRAGQADMVQGHRNDVARMSEKLITWLAHLRAPVGDTGTGLRALRTELARDLKIEGKCICGVFSLEAAHKGCRIREVPVNLQKIDKPRNIAWYHARQILYLLPWLFKKYPKMK